MNWQALGKAVARIIVVMVEYSLKFCAFLAAVATLGYKDTFTERILSGAASIPVVFQNIPTFYRQATGNIELIYAYNAFPMSEFGKLYEARAIEGVMASLNEVVLYFLGIGQNLADAPLLTLSASITVFTIFYISAWSIHFFRRKGRRSLVSRAEKRLWGMLFTEEKPKNEEKVASSTGDREKVKTPSHDEEQPEPAEVNRFNEPVEDGNKQNREERANAEEKTSDTDKIVAKGKGLTLVSDNKVDAIEDSGEFSGNEVEKFETGNSNGEFEKTESSDMIGENEEEPEKVAREEDTSTKLILYQGDNDMNLVDEEPEKEEDLKPALEQAEDPLEDTAHNDLHTNGEHEVNEYEETDNEDSFEQDQDMQGETTFSKRQSLNEYLELARSSG